MDNEVYATSVHLPILRGDQQHMAIRLLRL
jgi:hypothetical protein